MFRTFFRVSHMQQGPLCAWGENVLFANMFRLAFRCLLMG